MDKYKQERHEYVKYMVDRILTKLEENSEHELLAFVILTLKYGLRKDEVLGINWNQINYDKKIIENVKRKNNFITEYLELDSEAERILRRLEYCNRTNGEEKIFPILSLKRFAIGELIGKNIGDNYFTTHELRGLATTLLIERIQDEEDKKLFNKNI